MSMQINKKYMSQPLNRTAQNDHNISTYEKEKLIGV